MKIIFAQGNFGADYARSRHNVGFLVVQSLAEAHNASFVGKPKLHAQVAELTLAGEKVLLVKPTTFYNETGRSARALIDFYKLTPSHDFLALHDDLALPFGTLRIRQKGSDAGNNGIKSLNRHLGANYSRLRIGIYNQRRDVIPDSDFVLSNFSVVEARALMSTIIPKAGEFIEAFCAGTLEATSHSL